MLRRIATLLLVISTFVSIYDVAQAQALLQNLRISTIDSSGFPNIKLVIQAYDSNNEPLSGLPSSAIQVSESGQPVNFKMEPYNAGIRVVFVIDAGVGVDAMGATGDMRISEMRTAIKAFLSQMSPADSVMVLIVEGDRTNVVSEFSSSTTDIQQSLESYQYNATKASYGYSGILEALKILGNQSDGKQPFIIFFTSGIQTYKDYGILKQELANPGKPVVHTVLFRPDPGKFAEKVSEIAKLGRGIYNRYTNPQAMNEIYQSILKWRDQYLVTYRTTDATNGNRDVLVTTSLGSNPVSISYSISLQPPKITIQEPIPDATITRRAATTAQGTQDVGTDYTNIVAKVEWPDGYPRRIVEANVIINNEVQGQTGNTDTDLIKIPWDLRAYEQIGDNPVSIQVQVKDELGIVGTSSPLPLVISVKSDACRGMPNFLCSAITFMAPYMTFVAAGLALTALVLVVVFRRQIATVGAPLIERGVEFVTRVTKLRIASTPKAYLEGIAGIGDAGRSNFEIYGTTPIGRSRRHAELIFQATDEDSPISRLHCTILDEDGVFYIRDEDSQWGTYVNGKKLASLDPGKVELHEGDEIELAPVERGGMRFRFCLADPSSGGRYTGPDNGELSGDESDTVTKQRRRS